MRVLVSIILCCIICGCGEHSLPREADPPPAVSREEITKVEELDSIARAAVLMMQSCFEVIDSSMNVDQSDAVKDVPVIDLDNVNMAKQADPVPSESY